MGERNGKNLGKIILLIIGAALTTVATIKPDGVQSNISAWLRAVGLSDLANMAESGDVGKWVLVIGVAILAIIGTLIVLQFRGYRRISRRTLTYRQRGRLIQSLRVVNWSGDDLWLRYVPGNDECLDYANEFSETLKSVGWNGEPGTTLDHKGMLFDLKLHAASTSNPPKNANVLASALSAANIKFDWMEWPELSPERFILYVYRQRRKQ